MDEKTVRINASKSYDVHIGAGLLEECGEIMSWALPRCHVAVITDSNVEKLYLERVKASLARAGYQVSAFAFPAGEGSKNIGTLSDILEFLAAERLTRSDCVAALGGGVTGDMAGFAAGCYLRGVKYVQMPTTFLAAVDSSVGGKTAIDLRAGKNLAGLFLQPETVICDTNCLNTLPDAVFADGAAEGIKAGILSDEELFGLFESGRVRENITEVIARCVAFKGDVVEKDEFETGLRKTLNLGHTVGHAVEKCSGYTVPHGHAVAIGMAVMARAAEKLGWAKAPCAGRIEQTLINCGLPIKTEFSASELAEAALADKKRSGGEITVIVPESIGECSLLKTPVTELEGIIAAGLGERA